MLNSSPPLYICTPFATLAQLVEHRIRNARVVGSSPMSGSQAKSSITRASMREC